MAYLKLQYITKDRDRHGNVRFYFRRPGKPKIRLHGLPGSEEFMAAYKEALSGTGGSEAKAEKSFEWLCERYFKSPYFEFLEKDTQRRKRSILNEVCSITGTIGKTLGAAPYRDMKKFMYTQFTPKPENPLG